MSKETCKTNDAASKEERLARALRANLARRKAQQRARQTLAPDKPPRSEDSGKTRE